MTDTAQERRQSPRAKVVVKVECRSGLRYVLGNLENISDHGMLVSAPETFAVAEPVNLRFMLPPPSGKVVEATASVLRSAERQHMAFQFSRLPEKSREAIDEYIATHKTAR